MNRMVFFCVVGVVCLALTAPAQALPNGGRHYAILFSGGGDRTTNDEHFYIQTKLMYETMTQTLGYEEVYVLFADGTDPYQDLKVGTNSYRSSDWSFVPSDRIRPGTEASLYSTLNEVIAMTTPLDYFHLWTGDHGGIYTPFGWAGPTEDTVYLIPWGGSWLDGSNAIHDDELAYWLKQAMQVRRPYAVDYTFFQCHSGGMIDDLSVVHPYTQRHFQMSSVPWNTVSIANEQGGVFAWVAGIEAGLRSTHELAEFVKTSDTVNSPRYSGDDIDIVTGKKVGENHAPVFEWAKQNGIDGDITVTEGQTVHLQAEVTDEDSTEDCGQGCSYFIDDPLMFEINGASAGHLDAPWARSSIVDVAYVDEGEFINEFSVRDDTEEVLVTRKVTVLNAPPILTLVDAESKELELGERLVYYAHYEDPGVNDVLTCAWDLDGDGEYDDCMESHGTWAYTDADCYTVSVRVTDGDGGVATDSFEVTVVPEPAGLSLLALGGLAMLRRKW